MKYIITKFFEKQFYKNVLDLTIEQFISKIDINSKNFIWLKKPFIKVKIKSKNKSYRLILSFDSNEIIILFINIFDKKDKKYWENINWKLHKDDILYWTRKNMECIKNLEYYNVFKN